MKTNNSVRVGVNYTVQTLHDGMRGIITEHWSGKSYPFWLERCDSGMTLYDTEAPLPLAKEVVDSFSDIGYYVPEDFYNTQRKLKMFKKAVVTLSSAVMFACSPAHAQQIPVIPMDCTTMAEIAEITMQSRQVGVPMREVYKLAMDSENKEFGEWATKIIKIVYASPRYSTKEHQKRASNEFGSEVYLACAKDLIL